MVSVVDEYPYVSLIGIIVLVLLVILTIQSANKKKQYQKAYDSLNRAKAAAKLANETNSLSEYFSFYTLMISALEQAAQYEEKVFFQVALPSENIKKLQSEKQWHARDAIEREYNFIRKACKNEYRNNRSKIVELCKNFENDIHIYDHQFDEETRSFANDLIEKLFFEFKIENYSGIKNKITVQNTFDLTEIDAMNGHDFESYCASILSKIGFINVSVTPGSGDQGVDVIAEKEGVRYAIQCKCYSSNLGNTPIQEVCAGKNMYNCHVGVVMTNRYFTESAKQLAERNGILLWDREKLIQMIEDAKREFEPVL